MSREKEIIEASIEYTIRTKPNMLAGDKFLEEMKEFNRNKVFEEGAKWADKTMVNKACEWLNNMDNIEKYLHIRTTLADDLAKAFRKAMEE